MATQPIWIPKAIRRRLTALEEAIREDKHIVSESDREFLIERVGELGAGKNVAGFFDKAPTGLGVFDYYGKFRNDYDRKAALTARHIALMELLTKRKSKEPLDPAEMASVYSLTTRLDPALKAHREGLEQLNKGLETAWQKLRQQEAAQEEAAARKARQTAKAKAKKKAAKDAVAAKRQVKEAAEKAEKEAKEAQAKFEADQAKYEKDLAKFQEAHKKWKKTSRAQRQALWEEHRPKFTRALTPGSRGYAELLKFQKATEHLPTWTRYGKREEPYSMHELTDSQWMRLATTADAHGIPVPRAIQHYIRKPDPTKPKEPKAPKPPKKP